MKPTLPDPVKLFMGILYSDSAALAEAYPLLIENHGPMDYESPDVPFEVSDYYVPEMGTPILRRFVSFENMVHPGDLARIKIRTNELEEKLAVESRRKVNLDPGYIDFDKVVLASAKYNGQKIYMDHGIWADLTLHFTMGRFEPYPWSFPDFKTGRYESFFLEMRKLYKIRKKRDKKPLDNR